MEFAEHLTMLLSEGRSLSATARRLPTGAPVPPCPDWTVRDLVAHTGGVYRWVSAIVGEGRTEFPSRAERAAFAEAPPDAELVEWLDDAFETVADVLTRADPGLSCVTIYPGPPPREFWTRRMAHETLVHRVDAELVAGTPGRVDGDVALDGLAELLEGMVPRRVRPADGPTRSIAFATDEGPVWAVRLGPEGAETSSDADADLTLAGPAADLHLVAWNRAEAGERPGVRVEGDEDVLTAWRSRARI